MIQEKGTLMANTRVLNIFEGASNLLAPDAKKRTAKLHWLALLGKVGRSCSGRGHFRGEY